MGSDIKYKDRKETNFLILHDSHRTGHEEISWVDGAFKGGLDMGLLSIGYNYVIERSGEVAECRGRHKIGTHSPGLNMDSIGICLDGGREEDGGDAVDNFTEDQREALLKLCHELSLAYPGVKVVGHTEVQRYRAKGMPPCPVLDMDLFRDDLTLYSQGYKL